MADFLRCYQYLVRFVSLSGFLSPSLFLSSSSQTFPSSFTEPKVLKSFDFGRILIFVDDSANQIPIFACSFDCFITD